MITTEDKQPKLIVSHAPFFHSGSTIFKRSCTIMAAALPAVIFGIIQYGAPALGVVCLAVSSAVIWEALLNLITGKTLTIGDGTSAMFGLLFSMMCPATMPWWAVITGTFIAIVIARELYGGTGGNPFNPAVVAVAVLTVSWPHLLDFDNALLTYDVSFPSAYPLAAVKYFGGHMEHGFSAISFLNGSQIGGIGATFGAGLIAGGIFLIAKGISRWEISLSFIAGLFITALLFHMADPQKYAGPVFHLFTGYSLLGVFFLATEDSSSPVNTIPMLIYGTGCGILTVLIRNIGAYVDGVVFAVLLMNLAHPVIDKIRPTSLGKV